MLSKPATADEAPGEGAGARADLLEDLLGVGAAVHGELPHHPVAVVVVTRVDAVVNAGPAVGVAVRLLGGLELDAGVQPLLRRYCTWRAISWSDRGEEGESLEEPEGKRDEAVMVSDAFEDRSRRGSRSPERRDRGREKSHDRPSSKRRSETRKREEARGTPRAWEPSSRRLGHPRGGVPPMIARVCSARGRPGVEPPASAARSKRHALERGIG